MDRIISETEVIAYAYLKEFGFQDEQIAPLIVKAKEDLIKTLTQLKVSLDAEVVSLDEVNNALHALKGLLFHLGNHEVADKLNDIRSHLNTKEDFKEISKLLFE